MNKKKKSKNSTHKLSIFLCIMILFIIELYVDNNIIQTSTYVITSSEIPESFDDTTIVHLSDLHSKCFENNNDKLLEEIDKINPDYIMMTGDMVNSTDTEFDIFFDVAKKLSEKYKVYYIVGNHELGLNRKYYSNIVSTLTEYNITILDNKKVALNNGKDSVNLYGMWYSTKFYFNDILETSDIDEYLGKANDGFNILLTHNPKDFEAYADWGADLILSGHVHGGMVRLPFVGALVSPDRTLFPKYSEGEYKINDSSMVVSRGLGRGLNGFRFFNRPEIGVIVLKSQK